MGKRIKELLSKMTVYSRWRLEVQEEVSVFGNLLLSEMKRSTEPVTRTKAEVRTSTTKGSGRLSRKESGYFSPEPRVTDGSITRVTGVSTTGITDGSISRVTEGSTFLENLYTDVTDGSRKKS